MSFVWITFYLTFGFSLGGALALELLTQKPSYNKLQMFHGIEEGYYIKLLGVYICITIRPHGYEFPLKIENHFYFIPFAFNNNKMNN